MFKGLFIYIYMSPVDRGLAHLPRRILPWVHVLRKVSPVSEMIKGRRTWGRWRNATDSSEFRHGSLLHSGFYDLIMFFPVSSFILTLGHFYYQNHFGPQAPLFSYHVTSHAYNYAKPGLNRLHQFKKCDHNCFPIKNILFTDKLIKLIGNFEMMHSIVIITHFCLASVSLFTKNVMVCKTYIN